MCQSPHAGVSDIMAEPGSGIRFCGRRHRTRTVLSLPRGDVVWRLAFPMGRHVLKPGVSCQLAEPDGM